MVNIKNRIIHTIRNLLFHHGYNVERIPDADQLFAKLHSTHEEFRRYELKKRVTIDRLFNNHKSYNSILKRFVPDLDINFTSEKFEGDGSGEYNLDVYRKVCFENNYYFEKVYFNDSYDLLKVKWFYKYVYPIVKDDLKVVDLFKIVKGDLITIIYFEHVNLVRLSDDFFHLDFFRVSKGIFKLSKRVEERIEYVPDYLKNYKLHFHYYSNIKVAEEIITELSNNKLTVKMIEEVINLEPLVLTHGDIYYSNVYLGDFIIDWDSFGFFPHGFETAFIFSSNSEFLTFQSFQELLVEQYEKVISKDQWEGFEFTCFYFFLIFTAQVENTVIRLDCQKEILKKIEKYMCNHTLASYVQN